MKLFKKKKISESIRQVEILGLTFQYTKKPVSMDKLTKPRKHDALIALSCIDRLFSKINNVKTLVLGTSPARCSYIENDTSINMGIDGQDLYYSYMLFEKYKTIIPNLENIVLFYSVFSPSNNLNIAPAKYRMAYYSAFFDIPYPNKLLAINEGVVKLEEKLLKLNPKYYIENLKSNHPCLNPYRFFNNKPSVEDMENLAKRELKLNVRKSMNSYVDALIKECIKLNKKVFIVCDSRNPSVRNIYPDNIYENIINISNSYKNVEVINLFDYELNEDDFNDLLHVNMQGAQKITKIINDKINER